MARFCKVNLSLDNVWLYNEYPQMIHAGSFLNDEYIVYFWHFIHTGFQFDSKP